MPVSVCLWRLCIVVTGCDGSRRPLHACTDGCLCYLLTTPHPDCRMGWCGDFWWKSGGSRERGYVKIGNCSDITYLTYFLSMDRKHVTALFIWTMLTLGILYFNNLGKKCIISEERFVLELPTSRAMLATARPSCHISASSLRRWRPTT